jgi:hypothetical protein
MSNTTGERQPGEKFYKWTITFEIDAIWVADGFDMTNDRAKDMIERELAFSRNDETRVKVLKAPSAKAILREQGYTEAKS